MTGIVIVTYNVSSLILLQIEMISRFCQDDHEIVIVDNSTDQEAIKAIEYHATQNGCKYIKTFASSHNGTDSHVFAANTAYAKLRDSYEYMFFLDHDNFPIKEFSVKEILKDKMIAGLGQGQTTRYFWAGCVMFNNAQIDKDLINFSANHDLHLDTGGQLYKVIQKYGEENCVFFNEVYKPNDYISTSVYNYYAEINDGMFMHFVNSSNWNNQENHQERINSLINILIRKTKDV